MVSNQEHNIKCKSCGATLKFKAGLQRLSCEYCGSIVQLEHSENQYEKIQEFDIADYEQEVFNNEETVTAPVVKCASCSAETTLGMTFASKNCPFCGTPLVIQQSKVKRLHKPHYLLPFSVTEKSANKAFQIWLKELWFAPAALKKYSMTRGRLQGIYLPFWTYDCFTHTHFRGERGVEYTTWVKGPKGQSIPKTSVRWYPAGGMVHNVFDDVLIPASNSLPRKKLEDLVPWDLHNLEPFNSQFLRGFKTENYQLTLRQGFAQAKLKMNRAVRKEIRREIGGNQQRIHFVKTEYKQAKFKHILLPTWVSAYQFNKKTYQFLVNARTAEVQGERPYSIVKITLAMIIVLSVIYLVWATDWQALKEQISAWF